MAEEDKLLSNLIDLKNYKSLKHHVLMRNDTSNTSILDIKKIKVEEFRKDGIVLEMPVNTCQESHMLSLFLFTGLPKKDLKELKSNNPKMPKDTFEVIGKVTTIEVRDKLITAEINFTQYDDKRWQEIMEYYEKKQEQIDELVNISKY